MPDVAAPPTEIDDTLPDDVPDDDAGDQSDDSASFRRPRKRRRLPRFSLPFPGGLELGLLLLVGFGLWWATRSLILTGLLVVAWLAIVNTARWWLRTRRANLDRQRAGRERLVAWALIAFVLAGCLAGIRAWSHRDPKIPPRDPPGPYQIVAGAVLSAWTEMFDRPAQLRAVTQTAPGYWRTIVEDSEGCWVQAVVFNAASPVIGGPRTPAPCPPVGYAPTDHGDRLDPSRTPPAQVALEFVNAWLTDGDWANDVAPGATINPLGRTLEISNLAAYPLTLDEHKAILWLEARDADGLIGLQVALTNDQGRWFVRAVSGSPAVYTDVRPLPTPTTTSTTSSTSTTNATR